MNSDFIGLVNTHGVTLLVLGVLFYLYAVVKNRELFVHSIMTIVITGISIIVLKELFLTPRPYEVNGLMPLAGLTYFSSFPSFHAGVAFALATTVALHEKRLGIFLLLMASLIGFGRVAAYVHYPVDIAFGSLLGVTVSLFFERVHSVFLRQKHS